MRTLTLLLACAALLPAQTGLDPRPRPQDYSHHAALPGGGFVAFDYHGRGIPSSKNGVILGVHLVIEAAWFPAPGQTAEIRGSHFLLKIDKMKHGIAPETAGMVAASLKYADWEQARGLQVEGGAGPVVYGPGRPSRRFPDEPGDDREARRRRVPRAGDDKPDPQLTEAETVTTLAFPEGLTSQVVSGYLYYRWGGSLKKIKKLTLDFVTPGGAVSIPIQLR